MDEVWRDAVVRGDADDVAAMVLAGVDVDARDRHGQTALMLAAQRGHHGVLAVLVAAGASLNVTAKYGLSALMLAVVNLHGESAALLARAGADRTLRGSGAPGFSGKTAHDLAVERGMAELSTALKPGSEP